MYSIPDSAIIYIQKEIVAARELGSDSSLTIGLTQHGILSSLTGNFSQAIEYGLSGLKAAERSGSSVMIATAYYYLGSFYEGAEDYNQALTYELKAKQIFESGVDTSYNLFPINKAAPFYLYPQFRHLSILLRLASIYNKSNQPDSAIIYTDLVSKGFEKYFRHSDWSTISYVFGNIYLKSGDLAKALQYFHAGMNIGEKQRLYKDVMDIGNGIAAVYLKMNRPDSAIYYTNRVLEASNYALYPLGKLEAFNLLASLYKTKNNDSAVKYLELVITTKNLLFNQQELMRIRNLSFNEQARQHEIENEKKVYKEKLRNYFVLGALLSFIIIAVLLYRNNKVKQKTNKVLESTLTHLKATQAQLIQSEKMASLGELTAGIAHEIQNPLNFVNNFSEINSELIEELEQVLKSGDGKEAIAIAADLRENEGKINYHGKRADSIVKGMLQHSRTSTGEKEPTDINALCDEYLRLSYHGLRSKDILFNALLETDFDPQIGKINIISQDISRVLLNLFNNAFYAVNERKKISGKDYFPKLTVTTKKEKEQVVVTIKDNGIGIPEKITDKIFQPFFTTKPTGQGTGLGLSLSYDIVKAHGGEFRVKSEEGIGSVFTIFLPSENHSQG